MDPRFLGSGRWRPAPGLTVRFDDKGGQLCLIVDGPRSFDLSIVLPLSPEQAGELSQGLAVLAAEARRVRDGLEIDEVVEARLRGGDRDQH